MKSSKLTLFGVLCDECDGMRYEACAQNTGRKMSMMQLQLYCGMWWLFAGKTNKLRMTNAIRLSWRDQHFCQFLSRIDDRSQKCNNDVKCASWKPQQQQKMDSTKLIKITVFMRWFSFTGSKLHRTDEEIRFWCKTFSSFTERRQIIDVIFCQIKKIISFYSLWSRSLFEFLFSRGPRLRWTKSEEHE